MIQMDYVDVDRPQGINIGATKIGGGGDVVQMIKIDDVINFSVSFLKIDVQGSEIFLLDGADTMIRNSRPIMFIEVENQWLNSFGKNSEMLLNKILSLGYVLVRINTEYPCDHVAIPRERTGEIDEIMRDVGHPFDVIDAKSVSLKFERTDWQGDINYSSYTINN